MPIRLKVGLQQIRGGQQIEFIENEREPANRASQRRVPSSENSSIQPPNLLASLNLLEIRIAGVSESPGSGKIWPWRRLLFFIPVVPLGRRGVYVECQSCAGTFSTDALETVFEAEMASAPQMRTTTDSTDVEGIHSPERVYATTSSMAVASMMVSLVAPCLCFLGVIPALVAIIFGYLSLGRIKASAGKLQGRGFAYVGMVFGCCWIVFSGAMVAAVLLTDPSEKESSDRASTQPNTSAAVLLDAESRIQTDRDGVAHGNTDHARELAAQFANVIGVVRNELFTEGTDGISLSGGKFITYFTSVPTNARSSSTCRSTASLPTMPKNRSPPLRGLCPSESSEKNLASRPKSRSD